MTSVGIDIGGTFTDVVVTDDAGGLRIAKVPSSRADPSAPVRFVLSDLLARWQVDPAGITRFVHGTTVATNAVLERTGARLGLLTTAGFEDVIEIGRQSRRQIYQLLLRPETPVFLAPGARRKGVVEAIDPSGTVVTPLDIESLERSLDALLAEGVEAIAVCFLFSFVNPVHEQLAAAHIRKRHPSLVVSVSSAVDPAFREYERTVVTAFDAYVKPGLDRYLEAMERDLAEAGVPAPLQLMQSRGGVCSARVARQRPIRLFLSGPAAGVVGAREVGRSVGQDDLITVDIGGTSCDISLIASGAPMTRPDGLLDGYRIRVPMVDVNSIGSGGGSIAWIDAGKGLRVGPQSAGSEPGPACYGRGGSQATVTDASIVLGLLDPRYFAGGALALNPDLAVKAIRERVAVPLGLTVEQAALGIHRVLNVQMAEGIRLVSISRGLDPRAFALMPFGGGGGLHATALARELGMRRIIVPRHPGVLCASGLLSAMVEHEASGGFVRDFDHADPGEVIRACARLADECAVRMREEGIAQSTVQTIACADVCYVGQAHYLEVPLDLSEPARLVERAYGQFCVLHDRIHGHSTRAPARFVNLRVVQRSPNARAPDVVSERAATIDSAQARKGRRAILWEGSTEYVEVPVYARDRLAPGMTVSGPALIEQADTTTMLEPGWHASVADNEVLLVTSEVQA